MKSIILLCIGVLGLWVAGNTVSPKFGALQSAQTPLPSPVALTVVPFSAAASFTPTPTPTTAPLATSTLIIEPLACPALRDDADESILYVKRAVIFPDSVLDPPITIKDFENRTLEFLNAGGSPIRLQDLWRNQQVEITVRDHDLNKDGTLELFLMVRLPGYQYHTGIAFLYCQAGHYRFPDWFIEGPYEYNPTIITIEDLNHDGYDEAILTQMWSGSGCDQSFWVIGWKNKRVERWLDHASLACNVNWMVRDIDADGTKEIVLEGHRSSASSGDTRRVMEIYALQDKTYHLISETLDTPQFRVDYMEDGYNALKNGDMPRAIELYEIAVFNESFISITPEEVESLFTNDPTLDDVTEANQERQLKDDYTSIHNTWAFAHLRLLTFYYYQGQFQAGEQLYQRMEEYFPEDRAGYEFREAAALFVSRWSRYRDIQRACQSANLLLQHYDRLPSDNWRGRLGFWNDFWAHRSLYGEPNWCVVSPPTVTPIATATRVPLPPPLPLQRIADGTASGCVPPHHADERLLYFDQEHVFALNPTTPAMAPEEFIDKALEFLNSGGAPLHLQDIWRSQGEFFEIQQRDLDGDEVEEFLFSAQLRGWDNEGGIGLFYCDESQYHFGGWYGGGEVISVEDLDQDGIVEIVLFPYSWTEECKPSIQVVQWQNGTYQDEVEGNGSDCTQGYSEYLIGDENGDGVKEIYIRGSRLSGSRDVRYVYILQNGIYRLFSSELEAPTERYHLLEDANRHIKEGHLTEAVILYESALSDESFSRITPSEITRYQTDDPNLPDEVEADLERNLAYRYQREQDERVLALFRLVVIAYANNDLTTAQNWLNEMGDFTEGSLADGLRRAAEQIAERWNRTNDIEQACRCGEQLINTYPLQEPSQDNLADFLENYVVNTLANGQGDWCPF